MLHFHPADLLLRIIRCLVLVIGLVAMMEGGATARGAEASELTHFRMVTGQVDSDAYTIGVGISSLAKMRLLPKIGLDVDLDTTSGVLESLSLVLNDQADLVILEAAWGDIRLEGSSLRSVATVWRHGDQSIQLLARKDVDADCIYELTKSIFENLGFLLRFHAKVEQVSLDRVLDGIALPFHQGAKRYYVQMRALPSSLLEQPMVQTALDAVEPGAATPDQETFVVYFDFDEAHIDAEAAAVIDRVAALPEEALQNATVRILGYTDSAGNRAYNDMLGQRRVNAVMAALRYRGFQVSALHSFVYGEQQAQIATADDSREARNRRVEISIDYQSRGARSSDDVAEALAPRPVIADRTVAVQVPAFRALLSPDSALVSEHDPSKAN